jgi:NAD(P)-dependent dehydrogenase (short-subunit alcohol dehydrogenase family)
MNDEESPEPAKPLAGRVAVAAGATRGAGRGIARALGEAGAVVYCTGRSTAGHPSSYGRPETIEQTAQMIRAAGGLGVAVRVDHTVEREVEALFARVDEEQGRLDILVNCIAGESPLMRESGPFWETTLDNGADLFRESLLSHIITAKHAAQRMIRAKRGLIVEVTEGDTLSAGGNLMTQSIKIALKALALGMAAQLDGQGVATLAITPGFLRSESMLEGFGVTEETWRDGGKRDKNFLESESPLFVGRAVAALAADPRVLERTGQLVSSWQIGREYGLTDYDGRRPDWGLLEVDFSMLPASIMGAIRTGTELELRWLETVATRTREWRAKLPPP